MRIGYLTGEYPRATDTFIQREVAALREAGLEVQTFSVRRTGDEHIVGPEQRQERDRTVYLLPIQLWGLAIAHLTLCFAQPRRYFSALGLAWQTRQLGLKGSFYQLFYFLEAGQLAREMQRRQIEHLHNHFGDSSCTVAMLASALGNIPFSFTLHGPAIFFEPYRWRLDEKLKRAQFVACISYFCRSQALLHLPAQDWPKIHIVHCGVDPQLFQPVQHDRPGQRLLYTGRLAAAKGLPVLLDSLALLKQSHPDVELLIVGDGGDRPSLEAQVQSLGLSAQVKFLGYQSQAQVRDWMQMTDVFVLPSFAEGVPVSLMEAMAAGVPVVTTRIAGISELVEEGASGLLVSPGHLEALTQALQRLLGDAALRQAMGEQGRRKIEAEFTIQREAAWLKTILVSQSQTQHQSQNQTQSQNQIQSQHQILGLRPAV
jgi:colanic acid/amylovoran biosynthesis glycosyltransferase